MEQLISFGLSQSEVGIVMERSYKSLQRHCRRELDSGVVKANARVAQRAFEMAVKGDPPAATFFWLKTRAHWRETDNLVVTGEDGGPIRIAATLAETKLQRIIEAEILSPALEGSNGHKPD